MTRARSRRGTVAQRPDDGNWRMLSTRERTYLATLEAVARAAERFNPPHPGCHGKTKGCPGCALDLALARLSRTAPSGGEVGRG